MTHAECPCCFGDNPHDGDAGCQHRRLLQAEAKLAAVRRWVDACDLWKVKTTILAILDADESEEG